MTETTLENAEIVLPDRMIRGHVVIRDGKIADVGEGVIKSRTAVDCEGDLVMPGLIELHTDNLERHIEPRPGVDWPHASAIVAHDAELASVGITTVFDAMRVGSIPQSRGRYPKYARGLASELLELRNREALRISHFLHLRAEVCSETLIAEMAEFGPDDRVGIVSLMDHTPGQRQFRDMEKLKKYVATKRQMSDAEFAEHVAMLKEMRTRVGEAHNQAAVAEAHRYGAILASHDDTTAQHVAVSAGYGVGLAEFPTTAKAAQACRDHRIAVMMGAPNLMRGASHSGNVAAGDLAADGLLDILSSDYVPSALLLAALKLGEDWQDLPRGLATVTTAPAAAAGLNDRGQVRVGLRADLIRVHRVNGTPIVRGVWSNGLRVA